MPKATASIKQPAKPGCPCCALSLLQRGIERLGQYESWLQPTPNQLHERQSKRQIERQRDRDRDRDTHTTDTHDRHTRQTHTTDTHDRHTPQSTSIRSTDQHPNNPPNNIWTLVEASKEEAPEFVTYMESGPYAKLHV